MLTSLSGVELRGGPTRLLGQDREGRRVGHGELHVTGLGLPEFRGIQRPGSHVCADPCALGEAQRAERDVAAVRACPVLP